MPSIRSGRLRASVRGRHRGPDPVAACRPWQGAQSDFTYLLVPRRDTAVESTASASAAQANRAAAFGINAGQTLIVPVPIRRAITLTTTNLHDLESLGVLESLVGVGGGRYVCSPAVRARLQSGSLRDVGTDVGLDVENVVALRPALLFTYVVGNASDGGRAKLAETGVPVAVEGSYMEESPLGRAEWIKFTAAFFGKAVAADSIFSAVDSAYQALAALARTAKRRPTVFVGAPFGGVWWMASGRTYVGRLLADALAWTWKRCWAGPPGRTSGSTPGIGRIWRMRVSRIRGTPCSKPGRTGACIPTMPSAARRAAGTSMRPARRGRISCSRT
jgi:ABC-type Fe3+-hydroxamate transport system substrate-binding protein